MTFQFPGLGHNSIMVSAKAGVTAMDASLNEGKSQGLNRALQRQEALTTPPDAIARAEAAHLQIVPQSSAISQTTISGNGIYSPEILYRHILDANSGHAPGPKPAHTLLAEAQYLAARKAQN